MNRMGCVWLLIVMTMTGLASESISKVELERDGWNLISVCEDINRSDIDMNGIEEIQSQNGLTIYTGEHSELSNLDTLYAGYGYWVKGDAGVLFEVGESRYSVAQPLKRNGWNLMAACEDVARIDLNMTDIQEIQSQNGETIYTGEYTGLSNLESLRKGYGYWVNGDVGTTFTSKRALSIPSLFRYDAIDNSGSVVERYYGQYSVRVFSNYQETENNGSNNISLDISINGVVIPALQVQETYQGSEVVVAVYNSLGDQLLAVSENIVLGSSGVVSFVINNNIEVNMTVSLSGKVTYDRVQVKSNYQGLDFDNISQEDVRQVMVELIDANDSTIGSTSTDDNGNYSFENLPLNTAVKVRVYAKMYQVGNSTWDVKVVDNTSNYATYVMEGAMLSTGLTNSIRNLNASSVTRTAAPFAILDNIYDGMKQVLSVDEETTFPPLIANWSINNKTSFGEVENGDIGTSYYTDGNLFILGDINGDSDEYDDHVIVHEWGHYYEDKFSRSDSIGGSHGSGDHLDIRVAFGEGFGNAVSAMALNNPIYFDTYGSDASTGWSMNIESSTKNNPGWFSEASIQRILYDLYDSDDDESDTLSLGFAPLHNVFTNAQKYTKAFTSIFSFITALKAENSDEVTMIDDIVSSESIAKIVDIYGEGRINLAEETPLYSEITLGDSINVCISSTYGSYNKLGNRKYVQFSAVNSGNFRIKVEQSNGSDTDPDFLLFSHSSEGYIASGISGNVAFEESQVVLNEGSYLLDISEYTGKTAPCFNVLVNQGS